jgi:hypothetical protein
MIDRIAVISLMVLICIAGCVPSPSDYKDEIGDEINNFISENQNNEIKKETSLYTYVGVGLFVIGALTFAFAIKSSGAYLMLAGGMAGSVPYILSSDYFDYIAGGTLLCFSILIIHFVYWKIKKAENNNV